MPHLTFEYSGNLDRDAVHRALVSTNQILSESELFVDSDIKSRAYCADHFLVGTGVDPIEHAFVAVRLELLSGREHALREILGQMVLRALEKAELDGPGLRLQLSVQVVEMASEMYFKSVQG